MKCSPDHDAQLVAEQARATSAERLRCILYELRYRKLVPRTVIRRWTRNDVQPRP
jgi:hypothetical protein